MEAAFPAGGAIMSFKLCRIINKQQETAVMPGRICSLISMLLLLLEQYSCLDNI